MPLYLHECGNCKDPQGEPKVYLFSRSIARSQDKESCPDCNGDTYVMHTPFFCQACFRYVNCPSFYEPKCPYCREAVSIERDPLSHADFKSYYDEKAKCEVRSLRQEERVMKKTGKVYVKDCLKNFKNLDRHMENINRKRFESKRKAA